MSLQNEDNLLVGRRLVKGAGMMGRPERSLDPDDSALAQFAADLRRMRELAGRPTYRAMARAAHRSQTTLSEAAGGRVVPTWETVQAFLDACNVNDTAEWRRRWELLGDAAVPAPRFSPADTDKPDPLGSNRAKAYLVIGGGALVVVIAAVIVVVTMTSPDSVSSPPSAQSLPNSVAISQAVADGADPEDSGCANDPAASTVDAREVDVDQIPVGVIELRFSPQCGVSWPRFTPSDPRYSTISRPGPIEAHLSVVPGDNQAGAVNFSMRYVGLPVFGNIIHSTKTCVHAEAYLDGPTWRSTTGQTGCFIGSTAAGH
jgi:hypothetical protein